MLVSDFKYYRDLYYLTLPSEVNVRVSSVYFKLYKLNNGDLLDELKKTTEWKNLENIKNFNYKEYSKSLISVLGLDFTIYLINEFNSIMQLKTKISNKIDVYNYFKKYKRYSVSVYKNYKNKLLRIVDKLNTTSENFCCINNEIIFENYIDITDDINFNDYL